MTEDKNVVRTIAAVFAVQRERFDKQNYPYHDTESLWEDHLQAAECIKRAPDFGKRRIVLQHLQVLSSGRIVWLDIKVVWKGGKWVSPEHDPRAADPQYREYLRLKEIYDGD